MFSHNTFQIVTPQYHELAMSRPDIILREKRISVYSGDNGDIGERDFELVTSENSGAEPDIRLNPDLANIEAGGGDGRWSEGDLKLNDKGDDIRVQITAGSGSRDDPDTDRVWIDGSIGVVELGETGDRNGIRIDAGTGTDRERGFGNDILLSRGMEYDEYMHLHARLYEELDPSSVLGLRLGTPDSDDGTLVIDWGNRGGARPGVLFASGGSSGPQKRGVFSLGNSLRPGRIEVYGSNGKSIELQSQVKQKDVGQLALYDSGGVTTSQLRGDGKLMLGSSDSTGGEILLRGSDDGGDSDEGPDGNKFFIKHDGRTLKIEAVPSNEETTTKKTMFEIDANAGEVKVRSGGKLEKISDI